MFPRIAPSWALSDAAVTPRDRYLSRRQLVAGFAAAGALLPAAACASSRGDDLPAPAPGEVPNPSPYALPAITERPEFTADRPPIDRTTFATHNNYYEFGTRKDRVWRRCAGFPVRPWTVELAGEVHAPQTLDLDAILQRIPLEQRIYRFRCVEAWSMVVPWVGFPLRALLDLARPTSHARYVRLESFHTPTKAIGQLSQPWYPWPYHEGLRIDEATHDLALLAVGAYGEGLPVQNGAPLRLVVPWKYGFKSIKGIVRIELVREQPATLWNTVAPLEYGFLGNVDPRIPHPRWSQARERDLATGGEIPTRPYNGYGAEVAKLYTG